jgi:hypothetical protein
MTVQIIDATDQDNRHIRLAGCRDGAWTTQYIDFTKDSRKNDGRQMPFKAGNKVDDFFFLEGAGSEAQRLVDAIVLYDAG